LSKANDETASVRVPSSYQATTSRTTPQDTDGSNIRDTTSETTDTTSETTATTSETTATTAENNLRRLERLKKSSYQGKYKDCTRKYMHAETLALLTKPLYFPNMKYLEKLSW
jgi:hypothetical protein